MKEFPRVALFADTFHEVNGAANVIRRLVDFAREKEFPFMCIRSGDTTSYEQHGSTSVLELKRGALSIPIDCELKYDPLLWRHKSLAWKKLREFKPDIIHVTGLNDMSQLGFYFAALRKINAVASWHTNAHEYAAKRLAPALDKLPCNLGLTISNKIEKIALHGLMKVYFLAQMQLAPNEELVSQMREMTRRPSFLMSRGVDTVHLHPDKRDRADGKFVLGFVGRLRPEKNIRMLAEIDAALQREGIENYEFVVTGEGSEDSWLKENIRHVKLTGVLRGDELARNYANMDLFVFPSKTDAFGNVVLEAMAAGVPSLVMPDNGPKYLVEHMKNGYVAADDDDFVAAAVRFVRNPQLVENMREDARQAASERSWDSVFEKVYEVYKWGMKVEKSVRA